MTPRGVVAAGHPVSAEAGAWALREGGNAVDAAAAAVLASFAAESPLTGFGAGGYMLVHRPGADPVVYDFFVEMPGRAGMPEAELDPIPVYFTDDVPQTFNIGAASCGVYGTAAGVERVVTDAGTMPLASLVEPALGAARGGVVVNAQQAFVHHILAPILMATPESAAIYAPEGAILAEGERFLFPELGDALELFGSEGAAPFYSGEPARRVCEWVLERGGAISPADLASYEPAVREPVRAEFAGRTIFTNPPPSSGGILIAYALEILERLGESGPEAVVAAMAAAQTARDEDFIAGLGSPGFAAEFLTRERIEAAMRGGDPGSMLGSTTHIAALDSDGYCATVTCSNGSCSGIVVPETGISLNNMLGEEDLNPLGFFRSQPGTRMASMMSPTLILQGNELEGGLGSAGSNRIRSAVLQTIVGLAGRELWAQEAIDLPRIHFEAGVVHAEPGVDPAALVRLEDMGLEVTRWEEPNLYFGGVQAVARDPETGGIGGGGDPRRGGAVAIAE